MKKTISLFLLSLITAALLSNCSSKIPEEEYFKKAQTLIEEKKYDEAKKEFDNLLNEYPNGKFACKALLEIGKLYHGKVISGVDEKTSLKMGVDYYEKSYRKCPDAEESPKALFMAAFIKANELNDIEGAKSAYNEFLAKFPDNDLAASAKIELDNLGVPADEFLKKKIKAEN